MTGSSAPDLPPPDPPDPSGSPAPPRAADAVTGLSGLIARRRVLVCCGAGGVGKTTVAAGLGVAAAAAGRRAVVVTIDPARRLADAIGIPELGNQPAEVFRPAGSGGVLAAMMLDTKATFDGVVNRFAASPAQAEAIIANPFYRNVSTTLSGTQDYMAAEKLLDLHDSGLWDLIVVDTPPTRDALAFLEAPRLLTRLLDNPVYQMVTAPGRGALRLVGAAARTVLRRLSKVVGATVVDDAVAFFRGFEGMEQGFRNRAGRALALLGGPGASFVLVASARPDALDEASWFADRAAGAGFAIDAVVVNRVSPSTRLSPAEAGELAGRLAGTDLAGPARALAELAAAGAGEQARISALAGLSAAGPVTEVPQLPSGVSDLAGLQEVAGHLTARP